MVFFVSGLAGHPVRLGSRAAALVLLCCFCAFSGLQAATLPVGFTETDVGGYWNGLVGITFDEIGTLFQWDRDGRVWVFDNDARLATPLIDISEEVGNWGDHGLLGFALHPNFRQNGYIYLLYVVDHHYLENYGTPNYDPLANDYNRATIGRITRYTARASDNFHSVDPASRTILVGETATNGFPVTFDTHGAGTLMFGTDGTLLASFGDGGQLSDSGSEPTSFYQQALAEGIIKPKENVGSFRAQMIDSLSGKIIRIDPITGDGIPSNPFYDPTSPRAARSRVWVLGLRNPFRIGLRPGTGSHDRADGNPGVIYIGDVGYITWEKLSVATGPGINFGWPFYEGFDPPNSNLDYDTVNQDAPNPLYGTGGCDQPYFRFRDLLQKATLGTPSWPNPCDPAQQIPSSIPCFVHTRPAIDWNHNSSGPSRAGTFSGNDAAVVDIGASGAPVSGPQFGGNCSIGGVWYAADDFPLQYKNTYFIADFGAQWIRNMTFDASNNPVSVRNFASDAGSIVALATHPTNGSLYYVDIYTGIHKISYVGGGNRSPQAVATFDTNYGPTPLAVQFAGSASSDPEGQPLTFQWDFGDGSAASSAVNPQHIFTAAPGVPTRYNVTLTVTDDAGATNSTQLIVSVNNTPPSVTITSPPDGASYSVTSQSVYTLTATVTDQEQSPAQLNPQWQTILHHNNHIHEGVIDTNWTTSSVLSPFGCDGDSYYYSITLTVTDSAGLSAADTVLLYPDCPNNTPPTISDIPDQSVDQNESTSPISFDVTDFETASTGLRLSARSSNPALVPTNNIVFGGSGTARTLTVTPANNQVGTSTISILVNDGFLTSTDTFLLTVGSGTGGSYLFKEDFEGPGFENPDWIKHGTPDEDYTALPLHGSQSLHCQGMQYIERPFRPGNKFYLYFLVRWQAWGDDDDLIYWDDVGYSPAALLSLDPIDGILSINHGSNTADSQSRVNLNTTYHMWLEWTEGGGSDGTMKLFVSTDSNKPAIPTAALSDGNGRAPERMYLGPVSPGQDVIYDTLLVADTPIGSNPLQQSAGPRILSIGWINGNHVQIAGTGAAGATYKVQASPDLLTWEDIGSTVAASSNGQFTFQDPAPAAANAQFYRMALP